MTHDQWKSKNRSSRSKQPKALRWEPKTRAQVEALNSTADIVLFGGAAGSLKTETLLMDAVREADNPNLNAIIFRESYPQLADIIRKGKRLLVGRRPYWAIYSADEHTYRFPRNLRELREVARMNEQRLERGEVALDLPEPIYQGGATLKLGYLSSDDGCSAHDGQEYSFIGFDESTHHTEYQIRYLLSRLRSTDPSLHCRMRLASNPGNIGHAWHMAVFIGKDCHHCRPDSLLGRKPFVIYQDAKFTDGTSVNHTTQFIPGRVTDHNLFADPAHPEAGNEPYIRKLELQNPALAKALKDGCWAQLQGQYFNIWDETRGRDIPEGYHGPDLRMIIPFAEAPVEWWHFHFIGIDWGVGSSQAAAYLCARTPADPFFPKGRVYVLKELCRPESNVIEYSREFIFQLVFPEGDGERRKIVASYMGPDSWANRGDGHTIADQFQERVEEYGIELQKARTDREGGWSLIYSMLKSGELVICGDTCPELVRAIPTRLHDPKKPGDILKKPGDPLDDVIDALRYATYSFIAADEIAKPKKIRDCEAYSRISDPTSRYLWAWKMLREAGREGDDDEEDEPSTLLSPRFERTRLRGRGFNRFR